MKQKNKIGFLHFFAYEFQISLRSATQSFKVNIELAVYRLERVKSRFHVISCNVVSAKWNGRLCLKLQLAYHFLKTQKCLWQYVTTTSPSPFSFLLHIVVCATVPKPEKIWKIFWTEECVENKIWNFYMFFFKVQGWESCVDSKLCPSMHCWYVFLDKQSAHLHVKRTLDVWYFRMINR